MCFTARACKQIFVVRYARRPRNGNGLTDRMWSAWSHKKIKTLSHCMKGQPIVLIIKAFSIMQKMKSLIISARAGPSAVILTDDVCGNSGDGWFMRSPWVPRTGTGSSDSSELQLKAIFTSSRLKLSGGMRTTGRRPELNTYCSSFR